MGVKNYQRSLIVFVLVVVSFLYFGEKEDKTQEENKPVLVASNYALYDILTHVAPKDFKVVDLLPFGVDPHGFEPTPKTMATLENATLFFYSSDELEPWSAHISQNIHRFGVASSLQLREIDEDEMHEEHEEHHHHEGRFDPHYWLDPANMIILTQTISKELQKKFPKHKKIFIQNEKAYIAQLKELDKEYKKSLAQCQKHTIVVTHNAFGYMAQRYNFEVESLMGLSSEAQPSPKDVTKILNEVKSKGLHVVFGESFANQKTIKSIANDLDVRLETLQPLGNITAKEAKAGDDYISLMRQNLKKIAKAMECQ